MHVADSGKEQLKLVGYTMQVIEEMGSGLDEVNQHTKALNESSQKTKNKSGGKKGNKKEG